MQGYRRFWVTLAAGVGVLALVVLWWYFGPGLGDNNPPRKFEQQGGRTEQPGGQSEQADKVRRAKSEELASLCKKEMKLLDTVEQSLKLLDQHLGKTGADLTKDQQFLLVGLAQPLREDINKEKGLPPPPPIVKRDLSHDDVDILRANVEAQVTVMHGQMLKIQKAKNELDGLTPEMEIVKNADVVALVDEVAQRAKPVGLLAIAVDAKLKKLREALGP
jgi:hypothetical protein